MGRPKAWLPLGEETLLHRVAAVAGSVCSVVVVVAAPQQSLPPLPPGAVRVDDPPALAGLGPLAGALTGLHSAAERGADLVYLGAVDGAWITARHIDAMLGVLAASPDVDAIVPETAADGAGRRIVHATSGALRLAPARDAATALLGADQRALMRLYDRLGARRVAVATLPDPDVVRACNTLAQYEAARAWLAGRP